MWPHTRAYITSSGKRCAIITTTKQSHSNNNVHNKKKINVSNYLAFVALSIIYYINQMCVCVNAKVWPSKKYGRIFTYILYT